MANAKEARIDMYFHCKGCMTIGKKTDGSPDIKSKEYLAVGWTQEGIQIVCEKCGKSIVDIDFMKQKVSYYQPGRPYLTK